MPEARKCSSCGVALAPDAPGGHCLRCILQFGLETREAEAGEEEVAPALPMGTEQPGGRIGRFELLEQIGEGGFGVVYLAEQLEPVRRRVALKIIKLGMDTRSVIARFEAERQALALMEHPNIARVFDGGATETGRPYFVMEYVAGVRITEYCDRKRLSLRERLELFVQVCQAIQHAHQKGIIHRDLKPSNILVLDEAVPVPKVIDFGIAKATDQRLTDKTLFTAFEHSLGTPAYMSPEQADPGSADIDTRSDIYSLGMVLYELLTGTTPFHNAVRQGKGLEDLRRDIREKDPPRPSTCLNTMLKADRDEAARHRQAEPSKLVHHLRGDLDWIVMKTLEKERARRYETASGLALDIQRYLHNEPVAARPPSNLYRFEKLVRRNKLAFGFATTAIVALIAGLAVSIWLFLKEKQTRQRAQTEAAKSAQIAQLLRNMLKGVGPSVALGRDTTMLREILDQTAAGVRQDLTNQPEVATEMCLTLAATYDDLGLDEQEEAMARAALQFARAAFGSEHPTVGRALRQLGWALSNRGKLGEAEPLVRQALAVEKKMLGSDSPEAADSLRTLANVLWAEGKLAEAETLHWEALAIRRKLSNGQDPLLAESLNDLAGVLTIEGKLSEAEAMYRESLAMAKALFGQQHPTLAVSMNNLASVLRRQGKLPEAEALFRETLAVQKKLFGNEHPNLAVSLNNLALLLRFQGKLTEAESMQRQALAIEQKLLGTEHPQTAVSLRNLGNILRDQAKFDDAEAVLRTALSIQQKLLGAENPEVATSLEALGYVAGSKGKLTEAEAHFHQCLAIREKNSPDNWQTFTARSLLGGNLLDQKKFAEAEPLLLSGYEGMKQRQDKIPAASKPLLKDTLQRVVTYYQATGQLDRSAQWQKELGDPDQK